MRTSRIASWFFLLTLFFSVASKSFAVSHEPNGQILSSTPWSPLPAFESLDEFSRGYLPRTLYDEARVQTAFDILNITYASDGLAVHGLLIKSFSF